MRYFICIKSHSEAPDYEDECVAKSKKEATKIFLKTLAKNGWEYPEVYWNVMSEKEIK